MAGLYESRTPSYVFFFGLICGFAATNSRLYYDQVLLVINSGYAQDSRGLATCEPLRLYYDQVLFVINSGYAQDSRRDALVRTSPTESQPGDEKWLLSTGYKIYTASGLVRRGRPEQGGPLWDSTIACSDIMVGLYESRITWCVINSEFTNFLCRIL